MANIKQNYYERDVDFDELAQQDAEWARTVEQAKLVGKIDFQNPENVQALTRALLAADFGLTLELPSNRLCPPVPVRWNLVHWLQEVIDTTSVTYSDAYEPAREVFGLDIGTGASGIYALLACKTRSNWKMIASDNDTLSIDYAKVNVDNNGLAGKIKLLRTGTTTSPLIPMDKIGRDLDFCMTNPPFYDSAEDMQESYVGKTAPPSAVCTGSQNEMICPNGDVGFVKRIIEESLKLRGRVQWYSAMLGKLDSLQKVIQILKARGVKNWAVTSLQAGHRTKRWAVAWSFKDYRPRNDVARHGELVQAVLPTTTERTIPADFGWIRSVGFRKIDSIMRALEVKWQTISENGQEPLSGLMKCKGNVWARRARRQKTFRKDEGGDSKMDEGDEPEDEEMGDDDTNATINEDEVKLAVLLTCKPKEVEARWLKGSDATLFESFCGMLRRALNKDRQAKNEVREEGKGQSSTPRVRVQM